VSGPRRDGSAPTTPSSGPLLRAALALVLLAGGCTRGRGTPESTFEQVRSAAATRDPRLLYELHCGDARAMARQQAREARARLERGDAPEDVLASTGFSADEVRAGTLEDAAARTLARFSPLAADGRWYEGAVVAAVEQEHEDAAALLLRGTDGTERRLWLVREQGRWTVDGPRTWSMK
jgi:hypothetical protein